MPAVSSSSTSGWLRLIRPPNLITVPGDPLAGFLLAIAAGHQRSYTCIIPAIAISLLLYIAGLISNDYFDCKEDSADRPDRPIPSGSVSPPAALIASLICAALAIALAFSIDIPTGITASLLALLITLYNAVTKRHPLLGSLTMGACRGFSLLVGAVAAGWHPAGIDAILVASIGLTLYITAVTSLAFRETETTTMRIRRWLPSLAMLLCVAALFLLQSFQNKALLILALPSFIWPCYLAIKLGSRPQPHILIPSIGAFIRGLLLIQAAFAITLYPTGFLPAAGLILLGWPLNVYLAKWFYSS